MHQLTRRNNLTADTLSPSILTAVNSSNVAVAQAAQHLGGWGPLVRVGAQALPNEVRHILQGSDKLPMLIPGGAKCTGSAPRCSCNTSSPAQPSVAQYLRLNSL